MNTMKTMVDGSVITELFTEADTTWHILQREGGSVCLYSTHPHLSAHFVVYDSLDSEPPNAWAAQWIARLANLHTAIGAILQPTDADTIAQLRTALAEAQSHAGRVENQNKEMRGALAMIATLRPVNLPGDDVNYEINTWASYGHSFQRLAIKTLEEVGNPPACLS